MNHWVARSSKLSAGAAGRLRHHHVDAGRERADRLADRERGGDVGVERLLDLHLALPHLRAALLGEAFEVAAVEAALEVAADHRVDQVAVADAVDFDRDRVVLTLTTGMPRWPVRGST